MSGVEEVSFERDNKTVKKKKVKFYSSKSAITIDEDITIDKTHTLSLEVALGLNGEYDWGSKINVQLMRRELPKFTCVLLGWVPSACWEYRGSRKNKSITINYQRDRVYLKLCQGGPCHSIPIIDWQLYEFTAFALEQMKKNNPTLSEQAIFTLLKNTVVRANQSNQN